MVHEIYDHCLAMLLIIFMVFPSPDTSSQFHLLLLWQSTRLKANHWGRFQFYFCIQYSHIDHCVALSCTTSASSLTVGIVSRQEAPVETANVINAQVIRHSQAFWYYVYHSSPIGFCPDVTQVSLLSLSLYTLTVPNFLLVMVEFFVY